MSIPTNKDQRKNYLAHTPVGRIDSGSRVGTYQVSGMAKFSDTPYFAESITDGGIGLRENAWWPYHQQLTTLSARRLFLCSNLGIDTTDFFNIKSINAKNSNFRTKNCFLRPLEWPVVTSLNSYALTRLSNCFNANRKRKKIRRKILSKCPIAPIANIPSRYYCQE